jgi:hypothetical protein
MKRHLCLPITVALLLCTPSAAQAELPAPVNAGSIQGTVTRIRTTEPVPKVEITLSGGTNNPSALETFLGLLATRGVRITPPPAGQADERFLQAVVDTAANQGVSMVSPEVSTALATLRRASEAQFTALTDASGRFVMQSVPGGNYTVQARKEGCFGVAASGAPSPTATAAITVNSRETSNAALSMLPGGTISGRVTDSNGRTQSDLTVVTYAVTYSNGFPVLRIVNTKTTALVAVIPTDNRRQNRMLYHSATTDSAGR